MLHSNPVRQFHIDFLLPWKSQDTLLLVLHLLISAALSYLVFELHI